MTKKILHKLKKALSISFLIVVGLVLILFVVMVYFGAREVAKESSVYSPDVQMVFSGVAPDYGISGEEDTNISSQPDYRLPEHVDLPLNDDISSLTTETGSISDREKGIVERKLMQDGVLSLVVGKVEESVQTIRTVAENLGGRIDSVQLVNVKGQDKKLATVVMRVPSVNFNKGMDQVKGLAIQVQSENISTRDVTEQFIDMQARLKNLKAEEVQYLEIMKQAKKISDILSVSEKLYSVRQQIEQIQGQMNYLSRQVDMSIITITLSSEPEVDASDVIWSPSTVVKESIQGFLTAFYGFMNVIIVLALFLLPLLILWGVGAVIVILAIWKLIIKIKKYIH